MTPIFEELDYQQTPLGEISLRKRSEPKLDHQIVFEVKLGDEFLMSSLFVEAEEQLSKLALSALRGNGFTSEIDIVVGGLGLGYSALAALNDSAVRSVDVVEVMKPVINWHQQGLLPVGNAVAADPRCNLVHADFFALAAATERGFIDGKPVHAVLLDIDHSPGHWLNDSNQAFYSTESLEKLANKLVPQGIFGLWSNELVDDGFMQRLEEVFDQVENHLIEFHNPYHGGLSSNSIYIAERR